MDTAPDTSVDDLSGSAASRNVADWDLTAETPRPSEAAPASTARWRRPFSRFGLRARILLTFGLGSLALSTFLALSTYNLTRSNVVSDREASSISKAYDNARKVAAELSGGADVDEVLENLALDQSLLTEDGQAYTRSDRLQIGDIPRELLDGVAADGDPRMMRQEKDGELFLVVGIPLEDDRYTYFELSPIDDVRSTLNSITVALLIAGAVTIALGVVLGSVAAARAVRPLTVASRAAKAIAGGRLETRLQATDDPDLALITSSFNDMARALQTRIERDARFASDVSHELRSPLMTLSASVEVMQARRDEMPERARAALDLLVADVIRFQGLVEDLLEISRFDAGAIRLESEEFLVAEFLRQAISVSTAPSSALTVEERATDLMITGDRRRLARVVANLIDNGQAYGGGNLEISMVAVGDPPTAVRILVEDHGPGVVPEERAIIFERFARGAAAGRRSGSEGAGLGLSLVAEHVKLHGGRVWVENRRDGTNGACFVIELPATILEPEAI
ncbi:MAG: sensor histidine kinase [Ilumatobacteraceae bacterium]